MFKVGDRVAVCHDGKLTRAVEGRITHTTPKGLRIGISFIPWSKEEEGIRDWSCQRSCGEYSGFLDPPGERYSSLAEYYQVCPLKEVLDQGFKVDPYERPAYLEDKDEENRRL